MEAAWKPALPFVEGVLALFVLREQCNESNAMYLLFSILLCRSPHRNVSYPFYQATVMTVLPKLLQLGWRLSHSALIMQECQPTDQ